MVFELVFIVAAIVFPRSIYLILRANRQTPLRITIKNVLEFTLRQRTVASGKENLKGKFLKGMICLRAGR